jgi:superfamily II DNA or RNA helicase
MHLRHGIKPREWQETATRLWVQAGNRGIVAVVTGGGKTVFAEICISLLLEQRPDATIIVVVPTTALMDQWAAEMAYAFDVDIASVACWGGGEQHPAALAKLNVMVVNTASKVVPLLPASTPLFIIVDECHRAATATFQKSIPAKTVAALGLSATPERDYDDGLEQILVPRLGPIIFRYTYTEALQDGVITHFDLTNIRLAMTDDEQHEFNRLSRAIAIARRADAKQEHMASLLRRRAAIYVNAQSRVPWAIKLALEHRNDRVIIFHERLASLQIIIEALEKRQIPALKYDSSLGGPLRRNNLWLFRKGIARCLATCRALDEGANIPEANVAVVASASSSSRQRIQRLGRVLRPAEGKTKALIYTFYTTDLEHQRLEKEAESLNSIASTRWAVGSRRASTN